MPTVGDTARVRVTGTRGVTHESPIQDIVKAVYDAAYRYAKDSRFEPYVHHGPRGTRHGLAGPLVMKRLVSQVLPGTPDDKLNTIYGVVIQALKKTDSAVCVKMPAHRHSGSDSGPLKREQMPVWFVNHKIAGNIVPVVLAQAGKSADQNRTPVFSERDFLTPREKRLHESEVERPAGEVKVTRTAEERVLPLKPFQDEMMKQHESFVKRVLEEIQTQPVSVSATDLVTIINRDDKTSWNTSTVRNALTKLEKRGQIVKRKETLEEAKLRGGGDPPKATRPMLYASAPGPVPVRTQLPDGIEPIQSAKAYADKASKALQADRDAILEALKVRSINSPRTVAQIANAAGLPFDRAKTALKSLEADGQVYQNHSSWFPSFVRQNPRGATPEKSVLPPTTEVNMVVPTASNQPMPDTDENLRIVLTLAEKLGVTLPTGDTSELEAERDALRTANVDLTGQVEKLTHQVSALKAAIAALGD